MKTRIGIALVAMLALTAAPALATDGYFQLGYGTQQNGMAGASAALPLNTMAPATNPAADAWVTGYDLSVSLFNPNREFTVTGTPSGYPGTFGLRPATVTSGTSVFLMPAIGVTLMQLYIAPTFTFKLSANLALGVSPVLGYQRFQVEGVGSFAPYSSSPSNLSNNGFDTSLGWGVRIGYLGKLTPWLSVGASYQTEMEMSKFEKYEGLYAEHGDFDIPANWTVGVAVKPAESITVAFDVQQIYYSNTESVGNPMLPNLMTARLGDDGGAGFGWRDVTAYKLGLQWAASPNLTLRAGYAYAKQPIPESEVLFNILAPGVIEQHITAGVSA